MVHSRYLSQPFDLTNSFGCFWDDFYTEIIGFESMLLCFSAHAKCETKRYHRTNFFSFFLCLTQHRRQFTNYFNQLRRASLFSIAKVRDQNARHEKSVWRIALHGTLIKLHSIKSTMAFIAVEPCGKKCLLQQQPLCLLLNRQFAPFLRIEPFSVWFFWHGVMDALH